MSDDCIFDDEGHFSLIVVLWHVNSESHVESLPLVIQAHCLDFLPANDLSFTEVAHIFGSNMRVRLSVSISVREDFKICDSVDTSLPSDELVILINNDILVLEDISICHKCSL